MMWLQPMVTVMSDTAICDRCESKINLDNDGAICFNSDDGEIYLCEPCIEDIKKEFIETDNG